MRGAEEDKVYKELSPLTNSEKNKKDVFLGDSI